MVGALPGLGNLSSVFGMTWRFLPLSDPAVDIVVSRDVDSRYEEMVKLNRKQIINQDYCSGACSRVRVAFFRFTLPHNAGP